MRLLFVISTLTGGGAERAVSNITTHFPADVQADILLNSISEMDYPHGGNIISLGMKPTRNKTLLYQLYAFLLRLRKLRSLKKHGKYNACISFLDSANIANILSGKRYCKTILSVRCHLSQDKSLQYKYIVTPLVKNLYNRATKVVALSKGVELDLVSEFGLFPRNVITIYNGYDIPQMQQKSQESVDVVAFDGNCFYFVAVGRHTQQKGHWHLLRAFAHLSKEFPQARLIILGQGELTDYYKKLIAEYHLEDKVLLPGFVKNPLAILAKCDVFVFPSLFEGFGNVLLEGMVCGLPVIAADFRSGAREILAPDTDFQGSLTTGIELAQYGIIVPVCSGIHYQSYDPLEASEQDILDAMKRLVQENELRASYALTAAQRAREFDINKSVDQWLTIAKKGD